MFISTGMSNMSEVAKTVEFIRNLGNEQIILLHTVSNYPIYDLTGINLRAMLTMQAGLDVLIGYSDHTTTLSAPVAAVALGACVYERHFTIDKTLDAPDAALSADPEEMAKIVHMIRETEEMLGDGIKRCSHLETKMRVETRKSVVTTRAVKKDETLTKENLGIKRPGYGIPPSNYPSVIGMKALQDLPEDTILTWDKICSS